MNISKGGSFICNQNNLKGKIRFFREMSIIVLSIKLNIKTVIWGQSIGPVNGYFAIKLVNWILNSVDVLVLREKKCMKQYKYLNFPKNTIIGYDLAFSLKPKISQKALKNNTVGFTIKRFLEKEKDDKYNEIMISSMNFIIEELKYNILIVPHVTIDDDISKSKEIYSLLDENYKSKVQIDENDYGISELFSIYNSLDLLIGTRLHSTIFALCTNTKVINIGYHGTKSEGVFEKFNLSKYQLNIMNTSADQMRILIKEIIKSDFDLRPKVKEAIDKNNTIASLILK